jgi:uncharacterized protein YjiS (DUF1127 family)
MNESDEFYFLRFEHRPPTPEEWEQLQRRVVRGAKIARAEAVRRLFAGFAMSLRALGHRAAAAAAKGWNAYATWRERRRAVAELGGLDDRALKDFGLHRSEIESVVYGRDSRQVTEGKVAAFLFHKPYDRRTSALKPASRQLIDKNAA